MNSDHASRPGWNEGRSIHVGMNRVDDALYRGWLPTLQSAENDALEFRDLADRMGCSTRLLTSEDATREVVLDALESTIERLVPGDFLFLTYSGHMSKMRGLGDDPDGSDEAWCLFDGVVIDDEFNDLLAEVPADVDVLSVTDACFSGGLIDGDVRAVAATPSGRGLDGRLSRTDGAQVTARASIGRRAAEEIARLVRTGLLAGGVRRLADRKPIVARLVHLAAAGEGELAFEDAEMGVFTAAILEAVDMRAETGLTYGELFGLVEDLMPNQKPIVRVLGAARAETMDTEAFGIQSVGPARKADHDDSPDKQRHAKHGRR